MSRPGMKDPNDKDLHSKKSQAPYPNPGKSDVKGNAATDTQDPHNRKASAPHDRGVEKDGAYTDAAEDMQEKLGSSRDAWKQGKTQNG